MDKDERFKNIVHDPKFRRIPKTERKVKIDKRFKSMFKDKQFKLKYTVDKRGRPVNHTTTEDLKRYYDLSSDDESDSSKSNSDDSDEEENEAGKFVKAPIPNEQNSEVSKKSLKIPDKIKQKLKDLTVDYARGEGKIASDSSSDDESEPEESEDELNHNWGEFYRDADTTNNVTKRLAICNMDWDRIRATDLMVLFNSFIPANSIIESISIYPSEFGLQRMKEEEITGPTELTENTENVDVDEEENEEGAKYHMEKLRQYQLNRLKYYYGVIVCDSPETANKLYSECDGLEYESSANKIDLRFIPDDTTFDHEPKEVCNKLPEKYQPRFFTTSALQQAKVNLTWDETNPERIELAKKLQEGKIDDIREEDIQAYLATSSSEESEPEDKEETIKDDDNQNPIDKYRSLLQEIEKNEEEKKNKGVEMEVSWGVNLKEKSEKLVKKKLTESEDKTPFQQYLEKRKQKRKDKREQKKNKSADNESEQSDDIPSDIDMNDPYFAEEFNKPEFKKKKQKPKKKLVSDNEEDDKQAELELLLFDENDANKKHFSLKKIQEQESEKKPKKKFKRKDEVPKNVDDFEVNVNDDRFSALFTSHHYNIDPTDPHYRKTKAMEALIEEKFKRRTDDNAPTINVKKVKKSDAELNALVKSVKRKTQAFNMKK